MGLAKASFDTRAPASISDELIGDESDALFDGQYRLLRLLDSERRSQVFEAEQAINGEHVALKLFHFRADRDGAAWARFAVEARARQKLVHPNAVALHRIAISQTGQCYATLEYVAGKSLDELLLERGSLTVAEACELIAQLLKALGAAHALGIVILDLKPSSVLVGTTSSGAPCVKLLGFGSAEAAIDSSEGKSACSLHAYLAPERARGEPGDARSDIYSAAVMLYELLLGRTPFRAESPSQLLSQIVGGECEPLTKLRADLPEALVSSIDEALALHPQDRPVNAEEFAEALLPFADQAGGSRFPQHLASTERLRASRVTSGPALDKEQRALRHRRFKHPERFAGASQPSESLLVDPRIPRERNADGLAEEYGLSSVLFVRDPKSRPRSFVFRRALARQNRPLWLAIGFGFAFGLCAALLMLL